MEEMFRDLFFRRGAFGLCRFHGCWRRSDKGNYCFFHWEKMKRVFDVFKGAGLV